MSWDGKMYDKYRIVHTDGTPLNGEKYFVLRLDSDNPVEAARVAAAMRAYKSEPRNCDVGTAEEQAERYMNFCHNYPKCTGCPCVGRIQYNQCQFAWTQLPYKAKEELK